MNNNKTELIAVNRVKDIILESDILEPYIDDNDKTPSWDGNIFVYKSSDIKKKNLKGKIPIQVKGTKVDKFSNDAVSFSFETADLKNYFVDGGVLFFVVEVISINNVRIYYKSLLPIDIRNILSIAKNDTQKTISATLKPIDKSNAKSLESICFEFLFNRELQYSTVNYSKTLHNFNIVNFTVFTGGIKPNRYMLENEIYIYGKENKKSIPVPIDKVSIETITHQVPRTISINSKSYFDNYSVTESKSDMFVIIGKNIKFNPSTGKLNFKSGGSLTERLKEAKFLDELVRNKYFFIGDIKIEGMDISNKDKEQVSGNLRYLNSISDLMVFFNINEELNMDCFNKTDYDNLDTLMEIVLYNKKVKSKLVKTGVQHIKIGNIDILLLIVVGKDKIINIYNYFSSIYKMFQCTIHLCKDEKEIKGSFYSILKANDIVKSNNLDLTIIEEEVKSVQINDVYANCITLLILELIKAYDINKKLIKSLFTALNLCEWLEKYDGVSVVYKINRLQIKKRVGVLEKEERQELMDIRMIEASNFPILCGISILLDNKSDFEYYFEKLSDEERKTFMEYPIYNIKPNI
ncbi:hypothetical protein ACJDT4_12055 [Clostridium neuense]|uniref:DUF4365 domain-containing protein n=1 Tax=Clostridium neuense TaxID=1728934 RepID=A0ABW8TGM6_9CLOT